MSQSIVRAHIQATLTTTSLAHFGSSHAGDDNIQHVCRDADGKPYLPGSSLRGALRSLAESLPQSTDVLYSLFGKATEDDDQQIHTGKARIFDALSVNTDDSKDAATLTVHRDHVSLNPITRSAEEHKLFTVEYIKAGNAFGFTAELHYPTKEEIIAFTALLQRLASSDIASQTGYLLGGKKSQCFGAFSLSNVNIRLTHEDALCEWLLAENTEISALTTKDRIEDWSEDYQHAAQTHFPLSNAQQWQSYTLNVQAISPLLIKQEQEHEQNLLTTMRQDGKLVILASSMRGMLRAHCRKILMTMAFADTGLPLDQDTQQPKQHIIDALLDQWFGNTEQSSLIRVSDFVASDAAPQQRSMIAIDRFSGGGKDGALFSIDCEQPEHIEGQLWLSAATQAETTPALAALLTYLLRDGFEDDWFIGMGRSKGLGAIRLTSTDLIPCCALIPDAQQSSATCHDKDAWLNAQPTDTFREAHQALTQCLSQPLSHE